MAFGQTRDVVRIPLYTYISRNAKENMRQLTCLMLYVLVIPLQPSSFYLLCTVHTYATSAQSKLRELCAVCFCVGVCWLCRTCGAAAGAAAAQCAARHAGNACSVVC